MYNKTESPEHLDGQEGFMKRLLMILFVFLLVGIFSCEVSDKENDRYGDGNQNTEDSDSDVDGDGDSDGDGEEVNDSDEPPYNGGNNNQGKDSTGCDGMDILFVIDDSGSMAEEQTNLATNFPRFIDVLDDHKTTTDSQLNYRIGVTTTGVIRNFTEKIPIPFPIPGMPNALPMSTTGPDGKLLGQVQCGLDNPWLTGPGPNVATKFSCMAQRGTSGSGTEMPFAAMESALGKKSAPGGPNEGFYRKDENSLLVVVMITDEDDCSIENGGRMELSVSGASDCNENLSKGLYTPEQMKDFLDDLTGGAGRYVFVGIGGLTSCSSAFGDASRAKHVQQLVDLCAEYGVFGNICNADLAGNLEKALSVMTLTCDEMGPVI